MKICNVGRDTVSADELAVALAGVASSIRIVVCTEGNRRIAGSIEIDLKRLAGGLLSNGNLPSHICVIGTACPIEIVSLTTDTARCLSLAGRTPGDQLSAPLAAQPCTCNGEKGLNLANSADGRRHADNASTIAACALVTIVVFPRHAILSTNWCEE
jgi:hypothetical protein